MSLSKTGERNWSFAYFLISHAWLAGGRRLLEFGLKHANLSLSLTRFQVHCELTLPIHLGP